MIPTDSILSQLKTLGAHVTREWVERIVALLPQEVNNNVDYLIQNLFEQFIFSDISLSSTGSIPRNVVREKHAHIGSDIHAFQVISAVDISQPTHKYVEAVPPQDSKNTNLIPESGKRMLMFKLTDGIIQVEAIEYQPCIHIHSPVITGTKIFIRDIHFQRGVILLSPSNCQIIPGFVHNNNNNNNNSNINQREEDHKLPEVDLTHSPVLARQQQRITTNPQLMINQRNNNNLSSSSVIVSNNNQNNNMNNNMNHNMNDEQHLNNITSNPSNTNTISSSNNQNRSPFRRSTTELVSPLLSRKRNTPIKSRTSSSSSSTSANNMTYLSHDPIEFTQQTQAIILTQENEENNSNIRNTINQSPVIVRRTSHISTTSNINNNNNNISNNNIASIPSNKPIIIPKPIYGVAPFTYLEQIDDILLEKESAYIKARAFVADGLPGDGYKLRVMIDDGTGSYEAQFSDECCRKLFGFTLLDLKTASQSEKGLRLAGLSKSISSVMGIFTLFIKRGCDPVIEEVNEIVPQDGVSLANRIEMNMALLNSLKDDI